jgi:type I restriction enzyme M protein
LQLIDASGEEFWTLMSSNLGQKRREIEPDQISKILEEYQSFEETEYSQIHDVEEFGYRKVRIERPLRQNFRAVPERIENIHDERAFQNLSDRDGGEAKQERIVEMLEDMPDKLYQSKQAFEDDLNDFMLEYDLNLRKSVTGNIFRALSEKDADADIVRDGNGDPEPDSDLRDYEYVPLEREVQSYFEEEVKPYVEDAWINEDYTDDRDGKLGKVGYEINFNRYFYEYEPPRDLEEIEKDIAEVEQDILSMIEEVTSV